MSQPRLIQPVQAQPGTSAGPSLRAPQKPFSKVGLLVVDMQEDSRHIHQYPHGSATFGHSQLCKVIQAARDADLPIVLLVMKWSDFVPKPMPEIVDAAGSDARLLTKTHSNPYRSWQFRQLDHDLNPDAWIVGGFNTTACVSSAIRGVLAAHHQVITSSHILFGHLQEMTLGNNGVYTSQLTDQAYAFFRAQTSFHDDFEALTEFMRSLKTS